MLLPILSVALLGLTSTVSALGVPKESMKATGVTKRQASSTFPTAAGYSALSKPMVVTGTFDGKMYRFDRGGKYCNSEPVGLALTSLVSCTGQAEGGDSDAVFEVQEGGTLKNVIIGPDQIEGVHCMGACTIENVWWEAVCEGTLASSALPPSANTYRRTDR